MQYSSLSNTKKMSMITVIATIGGLCFGYDTGVISGALIFMSKDLGLSPLTEGFITSSLLFGAALGAVFGGKISDHQGRRKNLLYVAMLFILGALCCSVGWNTLSMLVARFILGLAVGSASVTVPVYIAELAYANKRERLVTVNELMIVTGQFLAYSVNAGIVNAYPELGHSWRIMLAIPAIPGLLLWIGMFFLPESPRYYISKGMTDKARSVLQSLRLANEVEEEIKLMQTIASADTKFKFSKEIKKPWLVRLLFIGLLIVFSTRITGVNTIMYYSPTVLKSTGLGDAAAVTGAVANGFISIVATIIGMVYIAKHSRRKMFLTGQIGVAISLVLIGITFNTCFHNEIVDGVEVLRGNFAGASYLVLMMMLIFLVFMQGWIAPVFWLMLAEIFPLKMRGLGMGIAVFALWIFDFIIQSIFPYLLDHYGGAATFGCFAVMNFIMILMLAKFLPETKGLSLEEIESKFKY